MTLYIFSRVDFTKGGAILSEGFQADVSKCAMCHMQQHYLAAHTLKIGGAHQGLRTKNCLPVHDMDQHGNESLQPLAGNALL